MSFYSLKSFVQIELLKSILDLYGEYNLNKGERIYRLHKMGLSDEDVPEEYKKLNPETLRIEIENWNKEILF